MTLFTVLVGLLSGCQMDRPPADVQSDLVAHYVKTAPKLDGKLDEPDWQRAPGTGPFVGPIAPASDALAKNPDYRTEVKVLWDKSHLYVGFICRAPEIFATYTKHDDKLYEQDVMEMFLDVGKDMTQYAELQASPLGVTMDCYHHWSVAPSYPADKIDWEQMKNNTIDGGWDLPGFQAATSRIIENGKEVGWTAELVIPVADLLQRRGLPMELSKWQTVRANFIRYAWLKVEGSDKREHNQMNWSPTMLGCPHVSPMVMKTILLGK